MPRPHLLLPLRKVGCPAERLLWRLLLLSALHARLACCSGEAAIQPLAAAIPGSSSPVPFAFQGCYVVPAVDSNQVERHNAVACNDLAVGQSSPFFALGKPPVGEAAGLSVCVPLEKLVGLVSVPPAACQAEAEGGRRLDKGGDSLLEVFEAQADIYRFVNMFGNMQNGYFNETGDWNELEVSGPFVMEWPPTLVTTRPSPPVGHPSDHGGDHFVIAEWANVAAAGREFVHRPFRKDPVVYKIHNPGACLNCMSGFQADATVDFWVNGSALQFTVKASGAYVIQGNFAGEVVHFVSDVDVVIATHNEVGDYMQVLPAAETIYGPCLEHCSVNVFQHPEGLDLYLTRECTNGTSEQVPPGEYSGRGENNITGASCRWSAPPGYKISGSAVGEKEVSTFVPAEYFQLTTQVPVEMAWVMLISDGPAACTDQRSSDPFPNTIQLHGKGAFHASWTQVDAGTVFTCDMPVMAVGNAICPKSWPTACANKDMNIIATPYTTTTTTTVSTTVTWQAPIVFTSASPTTTVTSGAPSGKPTESANSSTTDGGITGEPSDSNSSSTDTTTDTTTMTSTRMASVEGLPVPTAMVQMVEVQETALMWDMLNSNADSKSQDMGGTFTVAVKVNARDLGDENSLTVGMEGTDVEVTLPASLFTSLGTDTTCLMFTEFDSEQAASMGEHAHGAGEGSTVWAAVNVNLAWLNGSKLSVKDLEDPVAVMLPVNHSEGLECAFWDEANSRWSTDGVETESVGNGMLVCTTTHLTLFAAILRGFTSTFVCSQVLLLQVDAMRELGSDDWVGSPGALSLFVTVFTFVCLLAVATGLDCMRRERWSDEHFLVAKGNVDPEEEDNEGKEEEAGDEKPPRTCFTIVCGCCICALAWCKTSGAVRDALDDVVSNWIESFGEIRDFVEGLGESLEIESNHAVHSSRFMTLCHRIMWSMLGASARRQAASKVGISQDVAAFLMQDEHVAEVLLTQFHAQHKHGHAKSKETLHDLHTAIADEIDKSMERAHRWSQLPVTVWHLYLWQNPLGAALVHCVFMTSQLRVLLFMVDVFGSLALNTVFFQASGGLINKRVRNSECVSNDPLQQVGRIIAIGAGSVLVAGIPAVILGSLCTREVKEFDAANGPEWKRQLLVWRIQDRAIWTIGILYTGFCTFFMLLFFANVSPQDHKSWLISGLVSLALDIVIIPLCVALVIPLLATICLNIISRHKQVRKRDLVRERHIHIKNEGNMGSLTLPVVSI